MNINAQENELRIKKEETVFICIFKIIHCEKELQNNKYCPYLINKVKLK